MLSNEFSIKKDVLIPMSELLGGEAGDGRPFGTVFLFKFTLSE
jgi:hypothetical protein